MYPSFGIATFRGFDRSMIHYWFYTCSRFDMIFQQIFYWRHWVVWLLMKLYSSKNINYTCNSVSRMPSEFLYSVVFNQITFLTFFRNVPGTLYCCKAREHLKILSRTNYKSFRKSYFCVNRYTTFVNTCEFGVRCRPKIVTSDADTTSSKNSQCKMFLIMKQLKRKRDTCFELKSLNIVKADIEALQIKSFKHRKLRRNSRWKSNWKDFQHWLVPGRISIKNSDGVEENHTFPRRKTRGIIKM